MRSAEPTFRGRFRRLLTVVVLALLAAGPGAESASDGEPGTAILLTQLPADRGPVVREPVADGMLGSEYGEGARLVRIGPDGGLTILTEDFHSACDPDISFDGERVLFAGKRRAKDPWNIFELELTGGAVRQITDDREDARNPIYLGRLYTITADELRDQIAFVSTRAGELTEHGSVPATDLYSCRMDGSGVRRLTFNPSSELDPAVLPDGRLLFSSWQRATLDHGARGRIALFASQTDGLDYAIFAGDEGSRIKRMPAVTPDRRVVFVEGDRVGWDGAGRLASVDLRRNLHSYRRLTGDEDGLFRDPSPGPGGELLVARRTADGAGTHAIVRLDPTTGRHETVYDDPERHDIQPKLIAPRPRPDGRSSPVSDDRPNGVLYCLNVYESDLRGRGWIEPGEPVRLRVLEGVPRKAARAGSDPVQPLLQRRFLGEVDVKGDGSFNVEVPANIPIELQLVDRDGLALRTCSWIWVRNRETRGCIGCHEDGERTPENRFVEALAEPSVELTPAPNRRRTLEFGRDVAPVLARRCANSNCHGRAEAAPPLAETHRVSTGGKLSPGGAYHELLAPVHDGNPGSNGAYVRPGKARTSPLVWHVFGRNTSRVWDGPGQGGEPAPMPPSGAPPLSEEKRRLLIEWIDIGAPWGEDAADADDNDKGGAR